MHLKSIESSALTLCLNSVMQLMKPLMTW